MKMPKIHPDIKDNIMHELSSNWDPENFTKIINYDPVMGSFLLHLLKTCGGDALRAAFLTYKMIETQFEIDQLEEMFNENT